mmetsp:Transcript_58729/g.155357  ORF Transcript_58729/g.155357 Transcript_58729/m.155357 type:complete len:91 (+) Transcript_58729:999-1271(+)
MGVTDLEAHHKYWYVAVIVSIASILFITSHPQQVGIQLNFASDQTCRTASGALDSTTIRLQGVGLTTAVVATAATGTAAASAGALARFLH